MFDFYGHHDLNRFFLDEIREDLDAEERKFFLKSTFFDARIEIFRETMESIDETLFEQDATKPICLSGRFTNDRRASRCDLLTC